jgi:hypothetical protein
MVFMTEETRAELIRMLEDLITRLRAGEEVDVKITPADHAKRPERVEVDVKGPGTDG